jgi:hypothetical protein
MCFMAQTAENLPSKSGPPLTRLAHLCKHDADFYTWTIEQAQLLREGRFESVDIEAIAEELESLGASQKSALESHYRLILMHLLKWQHQPEYRTPSWRETVINHRDEVEILIGHNPGLKPLRSQLFESAYRRARKAASRETGLPAGRFPEECPWTIDQILDGDFWPS